MDHSPEHKCKRGCKLAADGQTEENRSANDHAIRALYRCDNHETTTQSTPPVHVAASQPQAYSSDDKPTVDARVRDLGGERCTPHLEVHREQDGNGKLSSIQLPKYRDDRDSTIIHFGVIGTHEGKTFIPKRSVHRNALDDLAYPYDEDQDFYVLDVNLDGDQIDQLLHYSEIYNAGGGCTIFLPKIADCLLTHP
jgi:hypothetical protein